MDQQCTNHTIKCFVWVINKHDNVYMIGQTARKYRNGSSSENECHIYSPLCICHVNLAESIESVHKEQSN